MEAGAGGFRLMLEGKKSVIDPVGKAGDLLATEREQEIELPLSKAASQEGNRGTAKASFPLHGFDHRKEGDPQTIWLPVWRNAI